jgi:hypothetical protein
LEYLIWLWNHPSHTKVIQWICCKCLAWYHFWPSRLWRLLEAKNMISRCTLFQLNVRFIPLRQFCLPKIHQEMSYDSQPQFSLHILNSRTNI